MISRRPYFLRAMHEWMVDSGYTPHLVVDANAEGVEAPAGYANDGKLVLNVSPTATRGLSLGNDHVLFSARFGGTPRQVAVPIGAVLAIYARETGQGIVFSAEDDGDAAPAVEAQADEAKAADTDSGKAAAKRPHLKVIK